MYLWGQTYRGVYEPLVTVAIYERCQRSFRRPVEEVRPRSLNNPEFPLRGLIACAECGKTLTGSKSRGHLGQRYPYYHHYNPGCAAAHWIPADRLEARFLAFLDSNRMKPEHEEALRARLVAWWKTAHAEQHHRRAQLRRQLAELESQRVRIFEMHRRGVYTDLDFIEQKQVVETEINEKRLLATEPADEGRDMEEAISSCLELLRNPRDVWTAWKDDYKQRISFGFELIPKKVLLKKDELRIPISSLIYAAKRALDEGESQLAALLTERWDDLEAEIGRWEELQKRRLN